MAMNRITRNKAAEIIGVTPQTISNYIKDGLLGSYKDEKGNFYVNGDDVERYAKKYKFIAVSEKMLDDKLAALKAEREKASNELAAFRRKMTGYRYNYPSLAPYIVGMIDALYKAAFVPHIKERERRFLSAFLKGENLSDLAEEYGLTSERIRQIIAKTCRKFSEQTEEIKNSIASYKELERQVNGLKYQLRELQAQYDTYRIAHEDKPITEAILPPEILQTQIKDCNFIRRIVINLNRVDVYTVGDLLTRFSSNEDLRRNTRNLGNKCISEIADFMDNYGLLFKEKNETCEHFYLRLNDSLKNI